MTPNEWILSSDTGVSSRAIWAVMMGATNVKMTFGFDIPHDPADFGRCYRLLELFPLWKLRLGEVSDLFPKWGPMVREWEKMTALYEEEHGNSYCPKLYDFMQSLRNECMEADGWIKTGHYSWERKS
jgi:hypothetical protein